MKRKILLLPVLAVLAASLTACQGSTPDAEDLQGDIALTADGCVAPGEASESLEITGEFGVEAVLSTAVTADVTTLERSVANTSTGEQMQPGQEVSTIITMINGSTAELIGQFKDLLKVDGDYLPHINSVIQCSKVGERVVSVMPANQLYDEGQIEAIGVPNLASSDSIVIVFDFVKVFEALDQATGKEIALPEGAPQVDFAANGEPTITIPEGLKAPKELTIHTMIEGEGETVQDGQEVQVHYKGIIWRTGEEFDSSWSRGASAKFGVNGVIQGFRDALVGQTVGSRVMTIVPPEAGYQADGLLGMGHKADDVMVFVLDILAVN